MKNLAKLMTNQYREVPLFFVNFNLEKFKEQGESGSCTLNLHPSLKDDAELVEKLNDLVDHIRKNHDMEDLV